MIPLSEATNEFFLALMADGMKRSTIDWYRYMLSGRGGLLTWLASRGIASAGDVTTHVLREYIVEMRRAANLHTGDPKSEASAIATIRAMHKYWAWLALEYDAPNPMARIAYPTVKPAREPKAVDLNDLKAMFAVCGADRIGIRDRAIMALLLDSGVRAAGLCGLTPDDVQIADRRALVTEKGDKTRFVVYSAVTADALAAWLAVRSVAARSFFHAIRTDTALTTAGLRNILRAIGRKAGVTGRVNPHSFRHAFAREYLKAGGDLSTLATLMGHRQASTTIAHYAIFTDAEVAERHESYSPMRAIKNAGDDPGID